MSAAIVRLKDIAERINAHLKRLEADASWNKKDERGLSKLWNSHACASGNRVFCTYVSYQGDCSLTKSDAMKYLEKLDAGYKGRHYEALRDEV